MKQPTLRAQIHEVEGTVGMMLSRSYVLLQCITRQVQNLQTGCAAEDAERLKKQTRDDCRNFRDLMQEIEARYD